MGRRVALFNILMTLCFAYPANAEGALTPVNFRGLYELTFSGLPFGKFAIDVQQTPAHYTISNDIKITGLLALFVQHSSHTTAAGDGADFAYPNVAYETRYQTRKKKKYVKMVWKDGAMAERLLDPPDDPASRPPVTAEALQGTINPLELLLAMRKEVQQGKNAFALRVFDGRRLTQVDFTVNGKGKLRLNGVVTPAMVVEARRTLVAGFTEKEIARRDPSEGPLTIYYSDDGRLIPLRMETQLSFGMLASTLARECKEGENCW